WEHGQMATPCAETAGAEALGCLVTQRPRVPSVGGLAEEVTRVAIVLQKESSAVTVARTELATWPRERRSSRPRFLRHLRNHRRDVAGVGVIHVGAELLGGEFPIALEHPSMHPTDDFGAALDRVEGGLEVPLH